MQTHFTLEQHFSRRIHRLIILAYYLHHNQDYRSAFFRHITHLLTVAHLYYSEIMSSARNETVSSNENGKNAGGKTKHGKPTGRREVLEKYKAIGLDSLNCGNRKELTIQNRVLGYGFNGDASFLVPMLAKERRRANKLAVQDQLLSLENKESQEEAEYEAREECDEMMSEVQGEEDRELADRLGLEESFFEDEDPWSLENIDLFGFPYDDLTDECDETMSEIQREEDRELADRLGIPVSFFEDPWSLETIDWFGFPYGDRTDEFWDNYKGVIEWARESGTYVDLEQAAWMAAPHFGEGCFVCKMMAKNGEGWSVSVDKADRSILSCFL